MGQAIDLAFEAVKDPTSTNIAEVTKQLSAIFTTIVALEKSLNVIPSHCWMHKICYITLE